MSGVFICNTPFVGYQNECGDQLPILEYGYVGMIKLGGLIGIEKGGKNMAKTGEKWEYRKPFLIDRGYFDGTGIYEQRHTIR